MSGSNGSTVAGGLLGGLVELAVLAAGVLIVDDWCCAGGWEVQPAVIPIDSAVVVTTSQTAWTRLNRRGSRRQPAEPEWIISSR